MLFNFNWNAKYTTVKPTYAISLFSHLIFYCLISTFIKVNAYEPGGSDPTKPKMSSLVNDLYGQAITDDSQDDNDRYPKKGDILFNSAPNSGEYSGWVCVKDYISSEIREEWKPFGLIES